MAARITVIDNVVLLDNLLGYLDERSITYFISCNQKQMRIEMYVLGNGSNLIEWLERTVKQIGCFGAVIYIEELNERNSDEF